MEKVFGATGRNDGLYKIGKNKWELIYGYDSDGELGWNWRHRWVGRKPSLDEVKQVITEHINNNINNKILSGLKWNEYVVWLSIENQINYQRDYSRVFESGAKEEEVLPVTIKLGTDIEPYFETFEKKDDLFKFYVTVFDYIRDTVSEGWEEKRNIDWGKFELSEE